MRSIAQSPRTVSLAHECYKREKGKGECEKRVEGFGQVSVAALVARKQAAMYYILINTINIHCIKVLTKEA